MIPQRLDLLILGPALTLLGARYDTREARAIMVAIGLQESSLRSRAQAGGPARSYWQFEQAGIAGILTHKATAPALADACGALDYTAQASIVHAAIEHNDILAACCARLLLFTHRDPLPKKEAELAAWNYYLSLWRPGKPRPADCAANWEKAWEAVEAK